MERTASLLSLSSRSSSTGPESRNTDLLLPLSEKPQAKRVPRIRTLLTHCLYRRVIVWTITSIVLVTLVLSHSRDVSVADVVEFAKSRTSSITADTKAEATDEPIFDDGIVVVVSDWAQKPTSRPGSEADLLDEEEDLQQEEDFENEVKSKPWLRFKHLDGYFHGIKALVSKSELVPEYPNKTLDAPYSTPPKKNEAPRPRVHDPYSSASKDIQTCYVDAKKKIPAPDVYVYDGIPQNMPDPALGSYDLFGIREDVCFDRFGRYGPYGFGYNKTLGGSGVGWDTENAGMDHVWANTGQINYNFVDWGDVQEQCLESNKHRFLEPDEESGELPGPETNRKGKKSRVAVVVRCYTGFKWTDLAVLNFRALITEVALKSGGEYQVHLLLHVRDSDEPVFADDTTAQRMLDANVPNEFHSLVTLWSESQMEFLYPGDFDDPWQNPSGQKIHGVYRSPHMPLQFFAVQHPEYEFFWNWEMDMRYVGNYYELLDRVGRWADAQPRALMWERNARYFIPEYHGPWRNFTETVKRDTAESGQQPIFGPVSYDKKKLLRFEQRSESVLPSTCIEDGEDSEQCGVGEGADLITLNPIFDVPASGWVFSNDVTGYADTDSSNPPRKSSIVTAGRLSRRLLLAMHEENWRHHQSMFAEMFPPSVALHHGFKAVFAPHPVYVDRAWQPLGSALDDAFNSGEHHSTSGDNSPFDLSNEHNQKGTTWYYHSEFAGLLWRRWLGYAQMDGRGAFGGRAGQGQMRGGKEEESSKESTGRMCLRSMLVHPIKYEHPEE